MCLMSSWAAGVLLVVQQPRVTPRGEVNLKKVAKLTSIISYLSVKDMSKFVELFQKLAGIDWHIQFF